MTDLIVDKAEKIRLKRKAIFDKGKIKLVKNRMQPIEQNNLEAVRDSKEYNRLAELHAKMKL